MPPGANARGRLAVIHRNVDAATTTVGGVPCVTVEQTFVDLAQVISPDRLRSALDDAVQEAPALLEAVRDRYCLLAPRGGRDLRSLRAALDAFDGDVPSESELERHLLRTLTAPGVPPIEWQAPFPGRWSGAHRVDGVIQASRVIVEGDGRAWHTRVKDFERDRQRDAEAAAAGYLTLRFTWRQLTAQPAWVRGIVRRTTASRAVA